MTKWKKASVVLSVLWALITIMILFNLIYIDRPDMGSDFWLVFIRSVVFVTFIPLVILWGVAWIVRKPKD